MGRLRISFCSKWFCCSCQRREGHESSVADETGPKDPTSENGVDETLHDDVLMISSDTQMAPECIDRMPETQHHEIELPMLGSRLDDVENNASSSQSLLAELPSSQCVCRLGSEGNPLRVGEFDNQSARRLRVVHISDTHGVHDDMEIPHGDILIHSGDFFQYDESVDFKYDTKQLDHFFARQPHRHKIFVAGNHEISFKDRSVKSIQKRLKHVTYLQDEGCLVEGLRVYGSPWTFHRGSPADAFSLPNSQLNDEVWKHIPDDTQLLITHCAPRFIIDDRGRAGSESLRRIVLKKVRPLLHMFGHAHQAADVMKVDNVWFSNGAQGSFLFGYSTPSVIDIYLPDEY